MVKRVVLALLLILGSGAIGFFTRDVLNLSSSQGIISPLAPTPTPKPKPLLAYRFSTLESYQPEPSNILIFQQTATESAYNTYLAAYKTHGKTMSMQIMVPETATPSGGFPVILMNRGFVDPAIYQPGIGTKNAAKVFASHGFVTIAPDFLGFGSSDPAPEDSMAARLEKPQQLLDLIASFASLSFVNPNKYGLWGHSNGGQIALSILEISGKSIPTVLWAPVSKPFPYSLLYYTDEYDDGGKVMRQTIAQFEQDYDVYDYSLDKFADRIKGPLEIHQGTADEEVPVFWSTAFVKTLKTQKTPVTYFVYPGADHNLQPDWQTVVERSLAFYQKFLYGESK